MPSWQSASRRRPSERSPSASSLPAGQITPSRSAMAASAAKRAPDSADPDSCFRRPGACLSSPPTAVTAGTASQDPASARPGACSLSAPSRALAALGADARRRTKAGDSRRAPGSGWKEKPAGRIQGGHEFCHSCMRKSGSALGKRQTHAFAGDVDAAAIDKSGAAPCLGPRQAVGTAPTASRK